MHIFKTKIKLLAIKHENPRVVTCIFEKPKGFFFTPGQFAMLSTTQLCTPSHIPFRRAFSFASSSNKQHLEFCIAKGETSNTLATYMVEHAKENDYFTLEGPYGQFCLQQVKNDIVFVAGGVGIAPLRSMIQHVIELVKDNQLTQKYHYTLLFSARTENELLYKEEFLQFEQYSFTFLPVITREHSINISEPTQSSEIKMNNNILSTLHEQFTSGQGKTMYICGSPSFVRVVKSSATSLGFSPIYIEQW